MKKKKFDFTDCALRLDGWIDYFSVILAKDDGYKDSAFPGCEYRYAAGVHGEQIAVNVKVTGRINHPVNTYAAYKYKTRVRVEFVQDDNEPSEFSPGFIYTRHPFLADFFQPLPGGIAMRRAGRMSRIKEGDVVISPANRQVLYRVLGQDNDHPGKVRLQVTAWMLDGELHKAFSGDAYDNIDPKNLEVL